MSEAPEGEVRLPESLSGVEPVQSVRTPIRLEYDYRPSTSAESYLRAYGEKRIIGHRSPVDGAVFIPPRGVDPRHGVAISDEVDLPDTGHMMMQEEPSAVRQAIIEHLGRACRS